MANPGAIVRTRPATTGPPDRTEIHRNRVDRRRRIRPTVKVRRAVEGQRATTRRSGPIPTHRAPAKGSLPRTRTEGLRRRRRMTAKLSSVSATTSKNRTAAPTTVRRTGTRPAIQRAEERRDNEAIRFPGRPMNAADRRNPAKRTIEATITNPPTDNEAANHRRRENPEVRTVTRGHDRRTATGKAAQRRTTPPPRTIPAVVDRRTGLPPKNHQILQPKAMTGRIPARRAAPPMPRQI